MGASAGLVIIFVCAFAGCAVWSVLFCTCAAHYFLTTLIDSSGGHDEVHYPSEAIIDWWWKPIYCGWILAVPVIPVLMVLVPFLVRQPTALWVCAGVTLWFLYPISLLSTLATQHWLYFLHAGIAGRMLRHYGAFAYVHLITMLSTAMCAAVLFKAFTSSFLWALPAALLAPAALLFYARHWGRFAWLSLNFLPRRKRKPSEDARVPVMEVEEVESPSEGIRAGLPPGGYGIRGGEPLARSTQIKVGAPGLTAPPEAEEDEWATDKKPYKMVDDGKPFVAEAAPVQMPAVATHTVPIPALEEEEDEWAPVKKPYLVEDPTHPETPDPALETRPEADRPFLVAKHYEDRARKEKAEAARKAAEAKVLLPTPSKKTPTFRKALFFGVWEFMIYGGTLSAWANLALLTAVELLLLLTVKQFWPRLD